MQAVWVLALLALLLYLVAIPLALIIWGSFHSTPPGVPSDFTLDNYVAGYGTPRFGRALRNTLVFAVAASVLAFLLGSYLAWLTERTNVPFRKAIYALVFAPLVIPGTLTTIAWVLVLNEEVGVANHALSLVGIDPVFNAYSMEAMVWADATSSVTVPFLLMAAAFRSMDPSLEEASRTAGASGLRTSLRVTVPLMTPAVLATLLIVFAKAVDNFHVPAVMGVPAGINVFSTEIWLATSRSPINENLAGALAVGYVLLTVVALAAYYKATGLSAKFATVTGKGFRPTRILYGRSARSLHAVAALAVLCVSVLVPLAAMVYTSLLPFYEVPSRASFEKMTVDNYVALLDDDIIIGALKNNVIAGVGAGVVTMLLSALIAWVVIRTRTPGRQALDALAFAPIAIPGIVIGLALMWFYLAVPVPIYASLWLIAVGYVTAYLPYGVRTAHASLSQVGKELEEVSRTSGAGFVRTFRSVTLPLMAGGLLAGFILVLSLTFQGLSVPIILAGPGNEVLPVLVFDLYQSGQYGPLNALGVFILIVLLVLVAILQRLSKRVGLGSPPG